MAQIRTIIYSEDRTYLNRNDLANVLYRDYSTACKNGDPDIADYIEQLINRIEKLNKGE